MNEAWSTSGSRKVIRLAALEKAIVGNVCARRVGCVWALRDGCVTPNLAVNARAEDSRAEDLRRFRNVPDGPLLRLSSLATSCRRRIRLRDYETGGRIVLLICPAYIRAWMAAEENH